MDTSNTIIELIYIIFILNIPQYGQSQTDLLLNQPERIESISYDQFSDEPIDFGNKIYEYNAEGEVILVTYYYDELNGKLWKEEAFEYDNRNKTAEKVTFFCDLPNCPNTIRTTTFNYQDACLVQEQ